MVAVNKKRVFSAQTRNNLILDLNMLAAGLISILTGIYFLILPIGGYQGGRNPYYGITVFFDRHTWDDLHTWSSVAIIALVALHIPLHWDWIVKMTKNGFRIFKKKSTLNRFGQFNLGVNVLFGLSGFICAVSGVYFLLVPLVYLGEINSTHTWDLIHTWSGIVMISAGILHFAIHWKWLIKVVNKYWHALVGEILRTNQSKGM
jgi:cytochrome b subunit of formate dehydrogenase